MSDGDWVDPGNALRTELERAGFHACSRAPPWPGGGDAAGGRVGVAEAPRRRRANSPVSAAVPVGLERGGAAEGRRTGMEWRGCRDEAGAPPSGCAERGAGGDAVGSRRGPCRWKDAHAAEAGTDDTGCGALSGGAEEIGIEAPGLSRCGAVTAGGTASDRVQPPVRSCLRPTIPCRRGAR